MKPFALIRGKIVTPKDIFEGTVVVRNGKIDEVKKGNVQPGRMEVIDLKGKYILPGLIDVHVHFRTPGMTKKEDWTTGSKAALAGGVTTVLDMPNTNPPTVDVNTLKEKRALVRKKALVNYGFYLGATADNLETVKKIKGIAGVKVYMGSSTGSLLLDHKGDLELFMAKSKKLLAIHAEDETCIRAGMAKYAWRDDPAVHSLIRAPQCAYEAVKEVLHLAKKYGARVHICHVSTEKELQTIRKFKNKKISLEVTPHHLFLTDKDYDTYKNLVKVNPPLRGLVDQVAMWEGIRSGLVDMIATDHAPHLLEEKQLPYPKAPSGVPGVQTMLPLLLNAVNEGKLTLEKVVALTSWNPARLFGIKGKGIVKPGADADITVVDMDLAERICHQYLWTKCNWSPFHGWRLTGWPVMTFVNGNLMYRWRNTFGKNLGKEVKFS
jgi:dihydroorotase